MIISNYIDKQAISTDRIIENFKVWAKVRGSKISKEQENEIRMLCKKYPILNILCSAWEDIGYESY